MRKFRRHSLKPMKKPNDQQKVLRVMIENGPRWFYSYELIGNWNGTFLSHRGPARISELSKYPDMIETDRQEKTYKYRFRFENLSQMLITLPENLKEFVSQEMAGKPEHCPRHKGIMTNYSQECTCQSKLL